MSIVVNGCHQDVPNLVTLAALLRALAPAMPYAVARNGEFIPRKFYAECLIQAGDVIEIVHPMAGG